MSYDNNNNNNNDSINNDYSNIVVVWLVSIYKIGVVKSWLTLYNSTLLQYQHNLPFWKCNEIKVYEVNIRSTIELIIEQSKACSLIYDYNVYHLVDCSKTYLPCNKMFFSQNYFFKMEQSKY